MPDTVVHQATPQTAANSEPLSRVAGKREPYSSVENALLKRLKEDEFMKWKDIATYFPGRSANALHTHYCINVRDG
jgi:hypothetical protein